MAKFFEYTEKSIPEDNDVVLIFDTDEAVNKKTFFSGIFNYIADKISSYSALLNRSDMQLISTGGNLDNYTTPGNYYSSDQTHASGLTNTPYTNQGFVLYVIQQGTIRKQIAIPTVSNEIKMRTYNTSWDSSWTTLS